MDKQQEYVLRTVEERDVRFIRLWFTDVLGFLKSFAITPAELEDAFEQGMGFDGDPRWVLRRNLERAGGHGFTVYVMPEMEFFLFPDAESTRALDTGSFFDQTALDLSQDFRGIAIAMLERMGISVMQSHHEIAPSQHEIDLREADALTMADNVMSARLVVKEAALEQGLHATFMPKPLEGVAGSGMDTHLSLYEGDRNAFYDPGQEANLSKTARSFIAGLLVHAHEYTAVTNQWINSFKRLVPGYDAPTHICWAQRNRSAMVRVGGYRSDRVDVEVRSPDPA